MQSHQPTTFQTYLFLPIVLSDNMSGTLPTKLHDDAKKNAKKKLTSCFSLRKYILIYKIINVEILFYIMQSH